MTLDEAREHIGGGVVYTPKHGRAEDGTITSVNEHYVFVRYAGDTGSKATRPEDLDLLLGGTLSAETTRAINSLWRAGTTRKRTS